MKKVNTTEKPDGARWNLRESGGNGEENGRQIMDQWTKYTEISGTGYIADAAKGAAANSTEKDRKQSEFDMDLTAGALYDALHERLALARTRALMGERIAAHDLLRQARADYETYKDALQGFPLHALDHAFTVTIQTLCAEKMIEAEKGPESAVEAPLAFAVSEVLSESAEQGAGRKTRSRKRTTKAA